MDVERVNSESIIYSYITYQYNPTGLFLILFSLSFPYRAFVCNCSEFASYVERTAWLQVLFGMLTQVSADTAFPSYNAVLGFWGVYAAINMHGRATFG
jgi:hypothetical protein